MFTTWRYLHITVKLAQKVSREIQWTFVQQNSVDSDYTAVAELVVKVKRSWTVVENQRVFNKERKYRTKDGTRKRGKLIGKHETIVTKLTKYGNG